MTWLLIAPSLVQVCSRVSKKFFVLHVKVSRLESVIFVFPLFSCFLIKKWSGKEMANVSKVSDNVNLVLFYFLIDFFFVCMVRYLWLKVKYYFWSKNYIDWLLQYLWFHLQKWQPKLFLFTLTWHTHTHTHKTNIHQNRCCFIFIPLHYITHIETQGHTVILTINLFTRR